MTFIFIPSGTVDTPSLRGRIQAQPDPEQVWFILPNHRRCYSGSTVGNPGGWVTKDSQSVKWNSFLSLWYTSGLQRFHGQTENWQNVHSWRGGTTVRVPGLRRGECAQTSMSVVLVYEHVWPPGYHRRAWDPDTMSLSNNLNAFTIREDTDFGGQRQIPAFLGIQWKWNYIQCSSRCL